MKSIAWCKWVGMTFLSLGFFLPCQAQPTPPSGGGASGALLDSWSFSDTNWLSDLGYAPLGFTNLVLTTNLGGGLLLDTANELPAYLVYNVVEKNGRTNLNCSNGTVSIWFSPDWSSANAGGTGPGAWGRFFETGTYDTNASIGWLALYVSPDGSTIYFSGQTNNGFGATYLSAPVTLNSNAWCNLVLTYGPTNSWLYFNGQPLAAGSGGAWDPGSGALTNGFSIGSSAADGLSQARGIFGGFSTFNYQWDSNVAYLNYITFSALTYTTNGQSSPALLTNAPSSPSSVPSADLITGLGILKLKGTNANGCVTSPNVSITGLTASLTNNQTVNVTFTITGGSNNVPYDVFATGTLLYPITNSAWVWLGQGYHCSTYSFAVQSNSAAFFILGTPQDSNGDSLTDAYQLLVSKTNPDTTSTDGLPNAWIAINGLTGSANVANLDPDSDGLSNLQEYLYGTKPTVSEGFSIFVANPTGATGIP